MKVNPNSERIILQYGETSIVITELFNLLTDKKKKQTP